MKRSVTVAGSLLLLTAGGCQRGYQPAPCPQCADTKWQAPTVSNEVVAPKVAPGPVTAAGAAAFMKQVDEDLRRLYVKRERAAWIQANFITDDTSANAADADQETMEYLAKTIKAATRFDGLELPAPLARQFQLLKLAGTLPAPSDSAKTAELAKITASMQSRYGKGKYCPKPTGALHKELQKNKDNRPALAACANSTPGAGISLGMLSKVLATSRNEKALREAWWGWRTISPPMRQEFSRYVELGNEGAKEIGFNDIGHLWRSGYDMPADAFRADIERLWTQVEPFYKELHCYVGKSLRKKYGAEVVPAGKPIPAHLLGNMWSQQWGNIYDLVEPFPKEGSPDVTKALVRAKYDEVKMVKQAESFFVSLGLDPLPQTFWKRSLFKKPEDRDVVCHASAWDVTYSDDLRIKMCIKITGEELQVVHHELGHNYYYHYYHQLPMLFQNGANDGFHEAIGDAIALSITPGYLEKIGLVANVKKSDKADINFLMRMALDKIAFLPFGKIIDQYRWDVFAGKISPDQYNQGWWNLRTKYQGIAPAVKRSEADFDPGAKYHVPGNVPYTRYFLAFVYQFQFQRALCKAAGHAGPLHTCSVFQNKAAGAKLRALLELGASKPWQDALFAMTGERQGDARALLEYFQPLRKWLTAQTKGEKCGW